MPNIPEQTTKFSEQVENVVRIIKHGKREQAFFLAGFLCLGLPIILPEALQKIILELFPNFLQKIFSLLSVIGVACWFGASC